MKDSVWVRIRKILLGYKKDFPLIAVCMILSSITIFLQPLMIRQITDQGMSQKNMQCILIYSSGLLVLTLVDQIIELKQKLLLAKVHNKMGLSLWERAYEKMESMPIEYYELKGSSEIVNTINADVERVTSITDQITGISITSILQIMGGILGLALIDWKLSLMVIIIIPMKYMVISWFSKRKDQAFENWIEHNRRYIAWIGDEIAGIREMKLWNLFQIHRKEFEEMQKSMRNSYTDNTKIDGYYALCESLIDGILSVILYVISGIMIVNGVLTIGGAFAFITYSGYVIGPIGFLINIKYYYAQVKPSAKRLFEFLDYPENKWSIVSSKRTAPDDDSEKPVLEFQDVCFSYGNGKTILKHINFKVLSGQKIAIIGENGSGKSTILDLVVGIRYPDSGMIAVNGVPVDEFGVKKLHEVIAVVDQKPHFFQGTVKENLNLDRTASWNFVEDVCLKCGIDIFVRKLGNGYEQIIGQNGVKLSGGERQKIAVARALIKRTDIIVMDEATSDYDTESGKQLSQMLQSKEFLKKTVIIVTHKIDETKGLDCVYEMKDGKLISLER